MTGAGHQALPESVLDFEHRILSRTEERRLILLYQSGRDATARDKIIKHNLALVLREAKRELNRRGRGFHEGTSWTVRIGLDDLVQEGVLGLIKALDRFDADKGLRFSTYAVQWIQREMGDALWRGGAEVRLSHYMQRRICRYFSAQREFFQAHLRKPTPEELVSHLGAFSGPPVDLAWVEGVERVLSGASGYVFLDASTAARSIRPEMIRAGSGKTSPDTDGERSDGERSFPDHAGDEAVLSADTRLVVEALEYLAPEDRELLELRYGLAGREAHSLNQLCRLRKCYKSNVVSALNGAHRSLRETFAERIRRSSTPGLPTEPAESRVA